MKMKIAIVATGKVARDNYIPFLAKQTDVELGYWNRTSATAQSVAAKFGGVVFTSLEALAAWQPTAAMVLTAETARYQVGTQLINLGVPRLFFEKPLVAAAGQAHVTEDDFLSGKQMLALAKAKGCETAIVFNYRFFDQTLAARQFVASRSLGRVIHFTGLVHYACWSHAIDLIQSFAGGVEEVAALQSLQPRRSPELKMDAVDVCAALKMQSGATGTILGTVGMKWQQPLFELTFTFENGRIHMRDLDGTLELMDGATRLHETRQMVRDGSRWDQYRLSFDKAVAAYLDTLRAGTPPPIPAIEGLRELQVEAAMKRSIAQRRPVAVQEEFPLD
jgi:predicted dehydrogenase